MRSAVFGVFLAMLLAGCSSQPLPIQETRLVGWGNYPPEAYIQVLQTPPPGDYVPIARLSMDGAAGVDRAQALSAMEKRARQLGANAIVITDESRQVTPNLAVNPSGGMYNLDATKSILHLRGEAIYIPGVRSGRS